MTRKSRAAIERKLEQLAGDETPPPGLVDTEYADVDMAEYDDLPLEDQHEILRLLVGRHYRRTGQSLADMILEYADESASENGGEGDE